jgi:hypothetical protein
MNHAENTVQKFNTPGDVVVVNINGRPTTLVIGREYGIKMKSGCAPVPYEPEQTKGAECEPIIKMPKANVKIAKQTLAAMKLAKRELSAELKLAAE